ncbi:MAG TPA: DUF896 family protein [Firmicutes bacterium]|jgi:uncharacterized protein YnzC (UPF0291/DUF896 family)|nr:DUF896 family protein [Bacillota bacterium]
MDMNKTIERINYLYHKSQDQELTAAEKTEQSQLRQKYLQAIKVNLCSQLEILKPQKNEGKYSYKPCNCGKHHH